MLTNKALKFLLQSKSFPLKSFNVPRHFVRPVLGSLTSSQGVVHQSVASLDSCYCRGQDFHTSTELYKDRRKVTKNKNLDDDNDDDTMVGIEDDEEGLDTNAAKVLVLKVPSLRVDIVLKSAFQIARNKIEKLFYESKLRVNGYKIYKKSQNVCLGDEIDIVQGFSSLNPKFLQVHRVKVLAASERQDDDQEGRLSLKIRRYRNLTVNNYEEDPYKESSPDEV